MTMTPDDLLATLRDLELELRSTRIQSFFTAQDAKTRERFADCRQRVSSLVGGLTNAELSSIATQLEALGGELQAGAGRLRARLAALDNAAAILDSLAALLGLAARVVQQAS